MYYWVQTMNHYTKILRDLRVREEAYRELVKKAPGSFCLEQSRQGHCIWHGCFTISHPSCCGPASSNPLKFNKSLAAIN